MTTTTRHLCSAFRLAVLGACLSLAAETRAEPRIVIEEFSIEPASLELGQSFTIRARAVATDVPLGSFQLRTADEMPKIEPLPGFALYTSGMWYKAEKGKYYLLDNGSIDEDPREGVFAVTVSTEGWKEGVTPLAFFASRRPTEGQFVAARRDLAVTVRGSQVLVEDLGGGNSKASRGIEAFGLEPACVQPGQPVRISARIASRSFQAVRVTNPYYVDRADTLAGFVYDAEQKKSFLGHDPKSPATDNGPLDLDKEPRSIVLELATDGWRPGVHHFVFELVGYSGKAMDKRSFALKVAGPRDALKVTVEESYVFGPGTHFNRFLKLRDGRLFSDDRLSRDQGRTWQSGTNTFGAGGEELSDGTVLGLD
ncbi:MAG: hypothetical protein ACYC6Y_17900, partial [Thermoguttaceae bacterium]